MSADKASPRPWAAGDTGNMVDDRIVTGADGKAVAYVAYGPTVATMQANAALIVQSVNQHDALLARVAELEGALRGLLAWAEKLPHPKDIRKHFHEEVEREGVVRPARAALR